MLPATFAASGFPEYYCFKYTADVSARRREARRIVEHHQFLKPIDCTHEILQIQKQLSKKHIAPI